MGFRLHKRAYRLFSVGRYHSPGAAHGEKLAENFRINRIILSHQKETSGKRIAVSKRKCIPPGRLWLCLPFSLRRGLFLRLQAVEFQFYFKAASSAHLAFCLDSASHQVNQPFRNAEPQSRSLDAFRAFIAHKWFKHAGQKRFRHANTRIADRKEIAGAAGLICRRLDRRNLSQPELHASAHRRILYRISQNIDQNLI